VVSSELFVVSAHDYVAVEIKNLEKKISTSQSWISVSEHNSKLSSGEAD